MTIDIFLTPFFYFFLANDLFQFLAYILGIVIIAGIVYNILE